MLFGSRVRGANTAMGQSELVSRSSVVENVLGRFAHLHPQTQPAWPRQIHLENLARARRTRRAQDILADERKKEMKKKEMIKRMQIYNGGRR
jgi:hypothetical protein